MKIVHICGGELEVHVYDIDDKPLNLFFVCKRCGLRFDESELNEESLVIDKTVGG